MIIHYDNIGAIGIIKDTEAHELSQDAWSDGQNVKFQDSNVEKIKGHSNVFDSSTSSPSIAVSPYGLQGIAAGTDYFWLYAGLNDIYATDGTDHAKVSSATASASANLGWNGGILGGVAILNNGNNQPQQWGDSTTVPSLSVKLKDLENWPADTKCAVMRPFKEFLVAMDITESGATRNKKLLRWSHPAEPGTVPASWDYTDPSYDAGRVELAEDTGFLIDGKRIRDTFIIYKENSTWGMQFIGAPNIFRFYKIFDQSGLLAQDCAQEYFGKHFSLTDGDVVLHDGQSIESVLRKRDRRTLFNAIDSTYYNRSFVVPNYPDAEMWICYVASGTTNSNTDLIQPNMALVWNWKENTIYYRELPGISIAAAGIVNPGSSSTFDADSGTFDSDTTTFDEQNYQPTQRKILMAYPATTPRLYLANDTEQFHGSNITAYIERQSLPIGRQAADGSIKVDLSTIKYVTSVYPRIIGNAGDTVSIYIGYQMQLGDSIAWKGPFTFTIGTDYKIDCRVTGRLISIRYSTASNITWKLTGFDIDVQLEGSR